MKQGKAYLFIILSALGYSVQTVFGKLLLNSGLTVSELTCMEFTIGTIFSTIIVVISKKTYVWKEGKQNIKYLILISLCSVATTMFLYSALDRLDAGISSMLMFTNPILICIFYMITKIKPITRANKIALMASILGCLFVLNVFNSSVGKLSVTGIIFGILASCSYAAYSIIYDIKLSKISSLTSLTVCIGISMVISYVVNYDVLLNFPVLSMKIWVIIIAATVITIILPAYFIYAGIRIIGAERASVVSTSELPLTLIVAYFVLHETLVPIQIVGVFLIVGAIFILQREDRL